MRESIIRLKRNHCVTAGAGAGKTSCLVEAYVGLLAGNDQRPPLAPRQIVAITFTEKAAAEMRGRVMDRVAALAATEGGRWTEIINQLEWSPISTIHGFCAALLREYGSLLGLDPDFAILDGQAFDEMLSEAVAEVLRQAMDQDDPALGRLLMHHGLGDIEAKLRALHQALATMGLETAQARRATAQAHAELIDAGPKALASMDQAARDLAAALAAAAPKNKAKPPQYFNDLTAFLEQWPELRPKLAQSVPDLATAMLAHKMLGGDRGKDERIVNARAILKNEATKIAQAAVAPLAGGLADDLFALQERLSQAVATACVRLAALSFDDLLLGALRLLRQRPELLPALRGRFRALMVDEFQDVNPVQGALVSLLCGLGSDDPGPDAPLMLIVGDRKQSIYAFRGADVSLYNQTMADFEGGGPGVLAALRRNFRSDPRLVEFFNRLFDQVFAQGEHRQHAPHAYVDFRDDDRQRPGRAAGDFSGGPALELLHCGDDDQNAEQRRAREATALAAHLAGLVADGQVRPGQIAILLRKLTAVRVYEEALRRQDLDFYTVKGKGFFGCQEVADVVMAMRALLWPDDDLAVTALLRSPLVGLSDESLLALAHHGPQLKPSQALAQGRALPDWLPTEQHERLAMARRLLADLGPRARRMTPAELLTAVIEAGDYVQVLAGLPSGEQKAANLRKLIETAREYDDGVEACLRRLMAMLAQDPGDAQAPLAGDDGQIVRIMTIHQAKGLQFPVVVLADLAGKAGGGPRALVGPDQNGVISPRPIDFASGQRLETAIHQRLSQRATAIEEAESARLFYVACTRAQERLVLCMSAGQRPGPWQKWADAFIAGDELASHVDLGVVGDAVADAPSLGPAAAWPDYLPAEAGPLAEEGRMLAQRCLIRPALRPAAVRVSVSAVEDFWACPRRFFLTQRLGLDTALLPGMGGTGGDGPAQAARLGSLAHMLLQHADLAAGAAGLELLAEGLLAAGEADDRLLTQASLMAGRFFQTDLAAALAQLPPCAVFREQPFLLCLPGQGGGPGLELRGEFDLLAPMEDGRWLIVDYKVGRRLDPAKYHGQMLIYAAALWSGGKDQAMAPPRAVLAHLGPERAALHYLEFTAAQLDQALEDLRQAAGPMADALAARELAQVAPAAGCVADGCPLGPVCAGSGAP